MAIDNVLDTARRVQYVASAAQTAFDYPFSIFDEGDLVVEVDGVVKTISTHYTVSGVGADNGGTVTFVSAMVGDEVVTIYSDTAIERTTDFQQNGAFASSTFNDEFDRLHVIAQELRENNRRSLRLPFSAQVDADDLELPPDSWANKVLSFDSDGVPTPSAVTGDVVTQATIGALLYPITDAEIAASVVPTNYQYPPGDVRRYGTNTTPGTTDMASAVTAACSAYTAGEAAFVYLAEAFYCGSDVPAIHDVQLRGPGYVQIGTGRPWWAEPDETNSTFAAPMTLYVDPSSGSDDNSGLASTSALQTLQSAANILVARAPLMGYWRIILAAGTHTSGAFFDGLHNTYKNPLYIVGPTVDAWDNTSPPASLAATGGSIPTAIMDGTGDGAGWAIDIRSHGHARIVGIKFTDWGTKATRGDEGAIRARDWSSVRVQNCHVWNCANAINGREGSDVLVDGGYFNGNGRYLWPIFARYGTGISATSAGDTEAELVENCTYGVDVFEGGNGHVDYVYFLNNSTNINVRRGGSAILVGPTIARTSGAGVGVQVQDGAFVTFQDVAWSGEHTPRVKRFNGGVVATDTSYDWRMVELELTATATTSTTETTVGSYTMPHGQFVYQPAAFRMRLKGDLDNTNGAVTVRVKIGGVTVGTVVLTVSGAAGYLFDVEFLLVAFSDASQHFYLNSRKFNTTGTVAFDDVQGADTTDYTSADREITVTLQCANASDTATSRLCMMERMG